MPADPKASRAETLVLKHAKTLTKRKGWNQTPQEREVLRARRVRRAASQVENVQSRVIERRDWIEAQGGPAYSAWDVVTPDEVRRLLVAARTLAKEAR